MVLLFKRDCFTLSNVAQSNNKNDTFKNLINLIKASLMRFLQIGLVESLHWKFGCLFVHCHLNKHFNNCEQIISPHKPQSFQIDMISKCQPKRTFNVKCNWHSFYCRYFIPCRDGAVDIDSNLYIITALKNVISLCPFGIMCKTVSLNSSTIEHVCLYIVLVWFLFKDVFVQIFILKITRHQAY